MRLLQMHDLAGLSFRPFRRVEPRDPLHHIGAGLEQVGKLLAAILTGHTQLLEGIELHRRHRTFLRVFRFIELNQVAVADRGGDMAGAVVFVVGAVQDQEHANEIGLLILHDMKPLCGRRRDRS